jgi:hypothetical protein
MYIPNSDLIPRLDILSSLMHPLTALKNHISADSIFCLQSLQTSSVNKIIILGCPDNTYCRNYNIRWGRTIEGGKVYHLQIAHLNRNRIFQSSKVRDASPNTYIPCILIVIANEKHFGL